MSKGLRSLSVVMVAAVLVLACVAAFSSSGDPQPVQQQPAPQIQPVPKQSAPQLQPAGPGLKARPIAPPGVQQAEPAPIVQKDPPEMILKENEFDAGNVNKGDLIKHDFVVENKGKGILQITHVQPSCGCTVTEFDKEVAPGKTGKITATVNTANFSGPIQKTISVTTNDTKLGNFQLTIKATVKAILNVTPAEYQQLGLVFKGQAMEKVFTLKAEDGTPFEITQVNADDPALKYDLKLAADKKSAEFKVVLPADHAVGPVSGRFTLSTTHPKAPTVTLSVYGTIREPLTVYPTELVYSGLNKTFVNEHPEDASLNKVITVSFEQAADLEIKKISSSVPFLEVTQTPVTPNQRYSVQVKLKPPVTEGDFAGTITIDTNKKVVTIPVRGKIF